MAAVGDACSLIPLFKKLREAFGGTLVCNEGCLWARESLSRCFSSSLMLKALQANPNTSPFNAASCMELPC